MEVISRLEKELGMAHLEKRSVLFDFGQLVSSIRELNLNLFS